MTERDGWGALHRLAGSVRFRITAIAVAAVLLVLVTASFALVAAQRQLLTENLDETLEQQADALAELLATSRPPQTLTGFGDAEDGIVQVVGAGGVLGSSASVAGRGPVADAPASDTATFTTLNHPFGDEVPYRLLSLRAEGFEGPLVVHLGAPLDDVEQSVGILSGSLAIALPTAAVALAAVVWWLVGRTLMPVEAIRSELEAISGTDLNRRVPVPTADDEIARLARTMNAMLDRVEEAAQRQQRFVADASHELRSPLARMRSEVEVDLTHGASADLAATHRSVLDEIVGLQRLAEDLLILARSDAAAMPTDRRAVDLDDIVLREARRLRDGGRVAVDVGGVTAAQVTGDAHQLARLVRNLADNAARHAASTVKLTLDEQGSSAVLAVADDGSGIPRAEHERVFERFTRLDHARNVAYGGTGLGLSIARDIVRRHGGTIVVDPDHRPGARLIVRIPRGS